MYIRFLPLLLLFTTSAAYAGTAIGHVTSITVRNDNDTVLFKVNKPIHNTPSCNKTGLFAIHLKKTGGMAAYMALLAAKQHRYTVLIDGMKNCSGNWQAEDVRTIKLN